MTKIKICGLFRDNDIDAVNEAMPDYIGFVFARSRRQVTVEQAAAMRRRLHPAITPVGVFVNESAEQIMQLFHAGVIGMAQLHGREDESYIRRLKLLCAVPVIKAIRVNSTSDIQDLPPSGAAYLLLDNGAGGTGQPFDWTLIPEMGKPYFLAGGIDEHNLDDALALSPFCIDVSSGAETDGVKDREKIRRLVSRVREDRTRFSS